MCNALGRASSLRGNAGERKLCDEEDRPMSLRTPTLPAACATAFLALGALPAEAQQRIDGGIGFAGAINPATDLATTNSIDIIDNVADSLCFALLSGEGCTGVYAVLNDNNVRANYNDFTFNPLPAGGVVPLWTFTRGGVTYSFDLTAITAFTRAPDGLGGIGGIALFGTGTARITGFQPTPATWSFSVDRATQTYRFSSSMGRPSDFVFNDGFE
ncbi:MAG TPA: hypothetical protein VND91_03385 [Candidatus Saccharimonadia bacterium]|nr:hypothetical protein [Candidatus Saccharimonadia bacterium]